VYTRLLTAATRHLVLRADDIMAFQLSHAQHYLSQEILSSENTARTG